MVLIDGDGCPVVRLAVNAANAACVPCLIVCDTAHEFTIPGVETVTVSQGADSADFALVNRISPGDLVVTQDYGLAAMCLAKGARCLNQDGMEYTADNMDSLLMARHAAAKIRRGGGRLKGSKKRTEAQDKAFYKAIEIILKGENI